MVPLSGTIEAEVERLAHGGDADGWGYRQRATLAWRREANGSRLELAAEALRLEARFGYRGLKLRVGFDSFLQTDLAGAPRGGWTRTVIEGITASGAARLVYVACELSTLARDVRWLGRGWRLDRVRSFDLFPQTVHVKTVLRMSRS